MMNLNEMTSKQLKELAKEHHVKNWWNLSKAALITALTVDSEATIESELDTCQPEYDNLNSNETEPIKNKIEIETVESEELIESELDTCQPEIVNNKSEETKPLKKPNLKIQELTFEDKTQSIRAWAKELELPYPTLYDRINRNGWTIEEALTIPLGGRRKK